MQLATIFHLSIYGLIAFSGWILGFAEEGPIPYGTVFLSPVAYLLIELREWKGLRGWMANLIGGVALYVAALEFFSGTPEAKLLSGAHLIVYLSWIVLLQEKNDRHYWALCALGLLQVSVAAVLSSGGSWIGPVLLIYLFASMWTLSVFSLFMAEQQFLKLGEKTALMKSLARPESRVRDALQMEGGIRWVTPRFVTGVLVMSVFALGVGAVFFACIPRVWIGQRTHFSDNELPDMPGKKAMTGFANTVNLGDMGQILESVKPVMTIEVIDAEGGEFTNVEVLSQKLGFSEPLFRGTMLTNYSTGKWSVEPTPGFNKAIGSVPGLNRSTLKERISLEPVGTDVLFYLGTPVACEVGAGVRNTASLQLESNLLNYSQKKNETFTYTVHVERPGDRGGASPRIVVPKEVANKLRGQKYLQFCLGISENGFEKVKQLSDQIVQQASRPGQELSSLEKAMAIETFLRDSGEYSYDLGVTAVDPKLDPIVDFVINRKRGHCEFFASALTIMLRQQGIPARVVSGFKGGILQPSNNTYEVQQRHAHAWSEAFIEDESGAYWAVLDATPPDQRAASVANVADSRTFFQKLNSAFSDFWTKNVMSITLEQQCEMLFYPLRDFALGVWKNAVAWANRLGLFLFALAEILSSRQYWSSDRGWATLIFLAISGAVCAWFLKRWYRSWARWRAGRSRRTFRGRIVVDFYEKLCQILRRAGWERGSDRTPHEFATELLNSKHPAFCEAEAVGVLQHLTELYYAVRFGQSTLTHQQIDDVANSLRVFEQAVTRKAVADKKSLAS